MRARTRKINAFINHKTIIKTKTKRLQRQEKKLMNIKNFAIYCQSPQNGRIITKYTVASINILGKKRCGNSNADAKTANAKTKKDTIKTTFRNFKV